MDARARTHTEALHRSRLRAHDVNRSLRSRTVGQELRPTRTKSLGSRKGIGRSSGPVRYLTESLLGSRFVYDEQSRLIGEYANDGKLISETVWFNDLPIATLRPKGSNAGTPLGITGTTTGNAANGATAANANNVGTNTTANRVNVEIFYIHPDHLGTPRVVTRSTIATGANAPSSTTANSPGSINKATWRRESDPFGTLFGNSAPNKNPQIITGTATQIQAATFVYDEMFPGQHRDRESGKFQNGYRDYDSVTGRYPTSDPIGLGGGFNTYAYVGANPLSRADPLGLSCRDVQLIIDTFYRVLGQLTARGDRHPNPYYNNICSTLNLVSGGTICYPYLGCGDQEFVIRHQLQQQKYDDSWTFTQQSQGPVHKRGIAKSSNPCDPDVIYDPWYGTVELRDKKSEDCKCKKKC
jgi:RHS repeat-associated protein